MGFQNTWKTVYWLKWWLHDCMHLSKMIELHTWKDEFYSVNFTSVNFPWVHENRGVFFQLRYSSHTLKVTILKCTIQWFFIYSQNCATVAITYRQNFHNPRRNPCLLEFTTHSSFSLTSDNYISTSFFQFFIVVKYIQRDHLNHS